MTNPTLMAQLVELQEENARLREDAERYRWIRDTCKGEPISAEFWPCIALYELGGEADDIFCTSGELDRSIDAARKEQK